MQKKIKINTCIICSGNNYSWVYRNTISESLAKTWKLNKKQIRQFNLRESQFCPHCKNSHRTRVLAEAIMKNIPIKNSIYFKNWIQNSKNLDLQIAEINSCGKLHKYLSKIPNIFYSEYVPNKFLPKIYFKFIRIRCENIQRLSYPDNKFDLVLHSEVLEHIPDYKKALSECRRILKPQGKCIFTVPYIPGRVTYRCAKINNFGKISYLKKPSYHGLDKRSDNMVWWEFGDDFIKLNNLKVIFKDSETLTYVFLLIK